MIKTSNLVWKVASSNRSKNLSGRFFSIGRLSDNNEDIKIIYIKKEKNHNFLDVFLLRYRAPSLREILQWLFKIATLWLVRLSKLYKSDKLLIFHLFVVQQITCPTKYNYCSFIRQIRPTAHLLFCIMQSF